MHPETLTLVEMILLISIPGLFGGLASALFYVTDECDCIITFWQVILRAIIGVAGAFGVVLLGFWVGKITAEADVLNKVFLISFSLIGGTISYKALPKIGTKLEEQFQIKLEEQKKEFNKTVDTKSEETRSYLAAITSAEAALARNKLDDQRLAIDMLEDIKDKFPINRTLYIKLGRLYRKLGDRNGDYNPSIVVLRTFIDHLNDEHEKIGKHPHFIQDSADAYFNISCYHVLKAKRICEESSNTAEFERLVKEALEALKTSIELLPNNREDAIADEDFDFIRDRDDFKNVVGINV